MKAPLDFFKSEAWLANVGHVLAGYAIILTTGFWTQNAYTIAGVWFLLVTYVLVKEYILDLKFESGETVGSSTVDALGYVAGAIVATAEVCFR